MTAMHNAGTVLEMVLEQERTTYASLKPELLEHNSGQFALIHQDRLLGTYTTFDEAYEAGVRELGNVPFLIQQVTEEDEVVRYPALLVGLVGAGS
jgi:hypothetical protein